MREKLTVLDKIAKTEAPVLILGESGTGKELFAEQVHLRSRRSRQPFVSINCAALPESLAESEIFGHVKGAFSGAVKDRKGRLELAEGGTLFLDEIADMSLPVQAKLLRFLAEKSFEKVGSSVSSTADVRIVAATNKNPEAEIKNDRFRKDLYYRLNVFPVRVPPLRERKEDIPALAHFFMRNYGAAAGKHFGGLSDDALASLLKYRWPGNVRELSNVIERACVIAAGNYIEQNDLNMRPVEPDDDAGAPDRVAVPAGQNLKTAVNDFKKRYIKKTLELHNWNQTRTAKVLEIERTYLSRLINDLEIEREK